MLPQSATVPAGSNEGSFPSTKWLYQLDPVLHPLGGTLGVQVLLELRVLPLSTQPPQPPEVMPGSVAVLAGHTYERVRERTCSFSQVVVPVWPEGQATETGTHCEPGSGVSAGQATQLLVVGVQGPKGAPGAPHGGVVVVKAPVGAGQA